MECTIALFTTARFRRSAPAREALCMKDFVPKHGSAHTHKRLAFRIPAQLEGVATEGARYGARIGKHRA